MPVGRDKLLQLDVLRGLCAVIVALHHVEFRAPLRDLGLLRHGALFVDFFFVLSGFIITYNYRDLATVPQLGRFMALRFARIYPLHLVMLFVFLLYETAQWAVVKILGLTLDSAPFSENDGVAFVLNLTLLNGVGLRELSFNIPAWSISSEFWTYLAFALVTMTFAGRSQLQRWAYGLLSLGALATLVWASPAPGLTEDWRLFLPRCLFSFFLGALVWHAWSRWSEASPRTPARGLGTLCQVAAVVLAIAVVSVAGPERRPLEFAAPLTFALVIAAFVFWPKTAVVRALVCRPLCWLGGVSYSVYMVHMIVLLSIEAFLRLGLHTPRENGLIMISPLLGACLVPVYLGLVFALAHLTHRYIELPGRELGRELVAARRSSQQQAQPVASHERAVH
jgi:peptidoglycan/LPS O-acetylase OafA/YrhL